MLASFIFGLLPAVVFSVAAQDDPHTTSQWRHDQMQNETAPTPLRPIPEKLDMIKLAPGEYNYTIYNDDCPCSRDRIQFCTRYRREGVKDGKCFTISHGSKSMRVWDPIISDTNHLVCNIFLGLNCDGATTQIFSFGDNTLCVDAPKSAKGYRSFMCHHPGW